MTDDTQTPTPATDFSTLMMNQIMAVDKVAEEAAADANTAEGFIYAAAARQAGFFMARQLHMDSLTEPGRRLKQSMETLQANSDLQLKELDVEMKRIDVETRALTLREKEHDLKQKLAMAEMEIEMKHLDLEEKRARIEQTKKGNLGPTTPPLVEGAHVPITHGGEK